MTTATNASHLNPNAMVDSPRSRRAATWRRLAASCFVLLLMSANGAAGQSLAWVEQAGGTVGAPPPVFVGSFESAEGVAVDSLGNSYITGTFRGEATFGAGTPNETVVTSFNGGQGIFVAKYDATGAFLWARGAGGVLFYQDWAFGIAVDSAGSSYVTGFLVFGADFGGGVTLTSPGAFVVKHDTNGNAVWATTLDPAAAAWAIAVDAGGNSFVAGVSANIAVWKVGPTGNLQWVRQAAGAHIGQGAGISVDTSGRIHVTGAFIGTVILGSGEPTETTLTDLNGSLDLFVAQYEASGNLIWARQSLDAAGSAYGTGISTDSAGNSYLVGIGTTVLGSGEANETAVSNAFVAKYDFLGQLVWARSIPALTNSLQGVAHHPSGHTYVVGAAPEIGFFVKKYGLDGDLLWTGALATSTDALEFRGSISLDAAGNAYIGGVFSGTVTFGPGDPNETILSTTSVNLDFDIFLAKYLDIVSATPSLNLKVNGLDPTPPVVVTAGPMNLTLTVPATTYAGVVSWYWALIYNGALYWVTSAGLSTTPAPFLVSAPVVLTDATLLNITLPPATSITNAIFMVDGGGAVVAFDFITASRP